MNYKFLRISLLSVFAFLVGGVALGAFAAAEASEPESSNETLTIFSATVITQSNVSFEGGGAVTQINNTMATIVGGTMSATNNQTTKDDNDNVTGPASKDLIAKQNDVYYFCMTNNDTYFTVELEQPLAEGDVISAKTYSRTDTELGLFISTASSRPSSCETALTTPQAQTASVVDFNPYTVKKDDGLIGQTKFNIFRSVGKTVYFGDLTITRTVSVDEEPGTGDDEPSGDFADASIEGEWNFTLDWHYAGEYSKGEQTEKYTATLDGNTVTFTDEWEEYPIVAEFTAKNILTFKVAIVGNPVAASPLTQNPFTDGSNVTDAGSDAENFVFETFTATYDPEAGTITFPEGVGLAYGYANKETGEFSYYIDAVDFVSASKAGNGGEGTDFADASIEGEWNFTLDWHYAGEYSKGEQTEKYTATLDGNTVTFTDEWEEYPIVAEFTAKNTLTFKVAIVGNPVAASPLTQNPFTDGSNVTDAGSDAENFVFETFTATYDPEAGTITFPEGVGLAYGYANKETGEFSYYIDAVDFISAKKAGAVEPDEPEEPSLAPGEYDVTYAMKDGETHTAGETIEVKVNDVVAATVTFGFAGDANYTAPKKDDQRIEGFWGYTEGNGANPSPNNGTTPTQGTVYIINPTHDGTMEVGVVLNADKAFYVLENGVALEDYNGKKETAKVYQTYTFNVTGGKEYMVFCTGSKLGFYGIKYSFKVPTLDELKSDLDAAIQAVYEMDLGLYTAESLQGLPEALTAATNALEDNNATAQSLTEALRNLRAAIEALVLKRTVTSTIPEAGYATFYADYAVRIPTGVTAYGTSLSDGNKSIILEAIDGVVIPANTAVIIAGDPDDYDFVEINAEATVETVLTGTLVDTELEADAYVLWQPEGGKVGFYHFSAGNTVGANKAYLKLPADAARLSFIGFGEATGINSIEAAGATDGKTYSVTGVEVAPNTKGLVIKNGKKYINK